jgi:uncharacterized repeat protein (TIGR02543 family)
MKRFAILFVALFGAVVLAQDLPKIAVYVTGNVPDDEKKALGTRMLATLINSGRYKGIERSNSFLAEIEKEQVKQRSGSIDDNQISELGRQFGVKFVCIADITPAFGEYQVSARIVNVETAEVAFIGESFSPLKSSVDLVTVSNQVVKNMFGDQAVRTYTVTVNINPAGGGHVSRNLDKTAYDAGDVLTMTAVANKGYTFTGWSGASSTKNPTLNGVINGDLTLTANFQYTQQGHTLAINVYPQGGGTITRNPDKEVYVPGEAVNVSATSAEGYKFTGWTGAVTGRKNFVTVKMDSNMMLTANFYQKSIPPPRVQTAAAKPKPEPKPKPAPEPEGERQKMFAIGGGLFYAGDFAGGIQWNGGAGILAMPYNAYGAYLFFNATSYATISLGYSQGGGTWVTPNDVPPGELPYMFFTSLSLGVFAKYPNLINIAVPIGGADRVMKIYPIAGIDYVYPNYANLEYENWDLFEFDGNNKYKYTADALSATWVKIGAGADLHITENTFAHVELLYGARTPNGFEKDQADRYGAEKTRLGHGVTFRMGAGFRL